MDAPPPAEPRSEGAAVPPPLVGKFGAQQISAALSAKGAKPAEVLAEIRVRGGLRDTACVPLVGLLEVHGIAPAAAHKRLLEEARTCSFVL
jgi:hypothetical protein